MSKDKRLIVSCANHGRVKNVLFMMRADDFRLSDKRFSANYTVVGEIASRLKDRVKTLDGREFLVYRDWSAKPL